MKKLKPVLWTLAVFAATLGPIGAQAQDSAELSDGEIRKIDLEAKKLTIKHGHIKSLDMPPMTMVFTVKDPALLEKVKTGDKVRFSVVREEGKMLVTEIVPGK